MSVKDFRIIGIDPGLETAGVSILDVKGNKYIPIHSSCIITSKNDTMSIRLKKIFNEMCILINKFEPDCLAIEELFFSSNTRSAINVGHARGVFLLAGSINNLKVYEYTPLEIKQAVVGYGRATKNQIKYMLKIILKIDDGFFPNKDDAWDAMAVSLCHANNYKFQDRIDAFK
ncbi:MAG: crossover junction endodeoxyribonuclease RuvC [Actinobacteria bacterium]|nr:crossover junction endodeoxyribonuclease RuvC [Actinomycetota bacterium]